MHTYDADTLAEIERLRLHSQQRRYGRQKSKLSNSQSITPSIKMIIGDWYVDELGVWTREIKARD